MTDYTAPLVATDDTTPDEELVRRCRDRDEAAVRTLTGRYNRRLFRIARSILRNDHEAEDVVQETYVRAFTGLDGFRGESSFSTWLVRIAMNDALGRIRQRRPTVDWDEPAEAAARRTARPLSAASASRDPEEIMARHQIQVLLERSIDDLPDAFRTVFVARMVEGMSIEDTASLLHLRPETVKTRLHRARTRLRADLDRTMGPFVAQAFPFDGARCDRMTDNVLRRMGISS